MPTRVQTLGRFLLCVIFSVVHGDENRGIVSKSVANTNHRRLLDGIVHFLLSYVRLNCALCSDKMIP